MRTLRLFTLVLLAIVGSTGATRADEIFVTNVDVPPNLDNTIGAYTTSGATVNPALISGLQFPTDIAVSGSNLFVVDGDAEAIGLYTTSGATVNPALISLNSPSGIAISGSFLFVSGNIVETPTNGTIGVYTTSGATVNPALISAVSVPPGISISGSDLFVVNTGTGTVGKYTTSGDPVNPALISGLDFPVGIAVSGSNLFVVKADLLPGFGSIGEYTTSGDTVNPALISGLSFPSGIAVVPTVPEPSSLTLTLFGLVLAGLRIRRIAQNAPKKLLDYSVGTRL